MRKIYISIVLLASMAFLSSCDLLNNASKGLSSDQIVQGLKSALNVGTDSSSSLLSKVDGYYGNKLLQIGLPPEAQTILSHKDDQIFQTLGISKQLNDQIGIVIKSINRSAEDAAKGAAPIFKDAITNLSITDGLSILNGQTPTTTKAGTTTATFDSLAATNYLKTQTLTSLTTVFSSPINNSLNKDLGLGFSSNQAWSTLTGYYNQGANEYNTTNSMFGSFFTPMETISSSDLGTYCTQKALVGLFSKVGDQEKNIRKNPYDWAIDIIRQVFGSVSK
jgi:hypothetical protein